jgi:hypothetical protein
MAGDEDLRAVVADIRLIAADCFDLRAVERLRLLVEQIEKRMLGARVVLTKQENSQGGGLFPSRGYISRDP